MDLFFPGCRQDNFFRSRAKTVYTAPCKRGTSILRDSTHIRIVGRCPIVITTKGLFDNKVRLTSGIGRCIRGNNAFVIATRGTTHV